MIARMLLWLIRLYQLVFSPLLGPTCRFEPSCSRYAAACIERFGAARGLLLGARRVARCHPFHPGGYDPPPQAVPPGSRQAPDLTRGRTSRKAPVSAHGRR